MLAWIVIQLGVNGQHAVLPVAKALNPEIGNVFYIQNYAPHILLNPWFAEMVHAKSNILF